MESYKESSRKSVGISSESDVTASPLQKMKAVVESVNKAYVKDVQYRPSVGHEPNSVLYSKDFSRNSAYVEKSANEKVLQLTKTKDMERWACSPDSTNPEVDAPSVHNHYHDVGDSELHCQICRLSPMTCIFPRCWLQSGGTGLSGHSASKNLFELGHAKNSMFLSAQSLDFPAYSEGTRSQLVFGSDPLRNFAKPSVSSHAPSSVVPPSFSNFLSENSSPFSYSRSLGDIRSANVPCPLDVPHIDRHSTNGLRSFPDHQRLFTDAHLLALSDQWSISNLNQLRPSDTKFQTSPLSSHIASDSKHGSSYSEFIYGRALSSSLDPPQLEPLDLSTKKKKVPTATLR